MKQFLVFLFALVFPVLFIGWWICYVAWQILKASFVHIRKKYIVAQKEFYGSNIS
jgi:hypothetical protein